jgi:hypothetical protein
VADRIPLELDGRAPERAIEARGALADPVVPRIDLNERHDMRRIEGMGGDEARRALHIVRQLRPGERGGAACDDSPGWRGLFDAAVELALEWDGFRRVLLYPGGRGDGLFQGGGDMEASLLLPALRTDAADAAARRFDAFEERRQSRQCAIPDCHLMTIGGEERGPAFSDQAAPDDRYRFRRFGHDPFPGATRCPPRAGHPVCHAGTGIGKVFQGFVGRPYPPPPHSELTERGLVGDLVELRCGVLDNDAFEAAVSGGARRQVDARARRDTGEDQCLQPEIQQQALEGRGVEGAARRLVDDDLALERPEFFENAVPTRARS